MSAFLGFITELMSHMVLLAVDAQMLSQRRPRGYILIACGIQRGGANSDAQARFQFRDVGLLSILTGNVHTSHFPCWSQCELHYSVSLPRSQISYDAGVYYYMGQIHALPNAQELRSEKLGIKLLWSRRVNSCDDMGWYWLSLSIIWGMCTGRRLPAMRCELKPIFPLFL